MSLYDLLMISFHSDFFASFVMLVFFFSTPAIFLNIAKKISKNPKGMFEGLKANIILFIIMPVIFIAVISYLINDLLICFIIFMLLGPIEEDVINRVKEAIKK